MMRSRNQLHKSKLDEFAAFAATKGYRREPTNGTYEVARFRLYDRSGTPPPIIIYTRLRGEHFTVFGDGYDLVEEFLGADRKVRKPKIEAEAARTAPASADDLPW